MNCLTVESGELTLLCEQHEVAVWDVIRFPLPMVTSI